MASSVAVKTLPRALLGTSTAKDSGMARDTSLVWRLPSAGPLRSPAALHIAREIHEQGAATSETRAQVRAAVWIGPPRDTRAAKA